MLALTVINERAGPLCDPDTDQPRLHVDDVIKMGLFLSMGYYWVEAKVCCPCSTAAMIMPVFLVEQDARRERGTYCFPIVVWRVRQSLLKTASRMVAP